MRTPLPSLFLRNVTQNWGEKGEEWLKNLPVLVQELTQQWNLDEIVPFKNLSYNFVARAIRLPDHLKVILKIGADPAEIEAEALSLKVYNGKGCARLFSHDLQKGAFLMEEISPGFSLKSSFPQNDEFAVSTASHVMNILHTHSQRFKSFPTLEKWLEPILEESSPIPTRDLSKARKITENLLNTQSEKVLLHGDLHHDNLLYKNSGDWIAIDPKGVIGERAYEIATFIRNPWPDVLYYPEMRLLLSQRFILFARLLDIDVVRLKEWSYVHCLLSAHWSTHNQQEVIQTLKYASLIKEFL
jgi:streptomycin 6-kinase